MTSMLLNHMDNSTIFVSFTHRLVVFPALMIYFHSKNGLIKEKKG
jgi:hypothetical protein